MRRLRGRVAADAPATAAAPSHDLRGLPYCRVSARFSSDGQDGWLVPDDLPLARFAPGTAEDELRQLLQKTFGVTGLELDLESTDACLCAFCRGDEDCWLASWDVYSNEDLVAVWDDLAQALSRRRSSRLLAARVAAGRVLLHLGYRPVAGDPHDLAVRRSVELLEQLDAARRSGLRHGGINERWVSLSPSPRVFGFGLASLYAAWRRQRGAQVGLLVADPRYASPAELIGAPCSARGDSFSLAALLTTSYLVSRGVTGSMPRQVMGADAFLQRIAWSEEWVPALRRAVAAYRYLIPWPGSNGYRRLAAALTGPVRDARTWWTPRRQRWVAVAMLAIAVLAAAVGARLVRGWDALPAGQTLLVRQMAAPADPDGWLKAHKKELDAVGKACSPGGTIVVMIGGQFTDRFTSTLTGRLAAAAGGRQPSVEVMAEPLARLPILVVACGVAE
jgi:hypothetical protein